MPESLAFDLYGTLVDPGSQADVLARHVDDPAGLAACWRCLGAAGLKARSRVSG